MKLLGANNRLTLKNDKLAQLLVKKQELLKDNTEVKTEIQEFMSGLLKDRLTMNSIFTNKNIFNLVHDNFSLLNDEQKRVLSEGALAYL